jgi:hypothetical protein
MFVSMHPAETREEVRRLVTAGLNDCEIARRLELPRTTVRDLRRAPPRLTCPRCWRATRLVRFTSGEYAELLALYLGDGCISRGPRSENLRISLDSRHSSIVHETRRLIQSCLPSNRVCVVLADGGAATVVSTWSTHLSCLFPQHGPGRKHHRRIRLEPWQQQHVRAAPWSFLRGLVHSDGCFFINRTGRYRYLSVEFANRSPDILDLFAGACDAVGVTIRRYDRSIRVHDRASVREFAAFVGSKR